MKAPDSRRGPIQLQRVRELFDAASEVEEAERAALLERECAADAELRCEVELLLNAGHATHPLLDHPLVVPGLNSGSLAAGECVGRYRIVREIGAGGMGLVYLVERSDGNPSQQFALKLVGWPSLEMARRLEAESRILSRLEHPQIARLVDTGISTAGLPFLVMEFADGQPINCYCGKHRLAVRERVRVFRQVCAAVRYLHQNLVIHRDLKPANILVTAGGAVKVVDFGIAKLLEPGPGMASLGVTATPMTPEYASPEQLRGEALSTLTDVYSLGAVLFEVLAEVKPFGGGVLDVLRKVSQDEPPRPGAAQPRAGISADLNTIVVKAMQQDPGRRYGSVEQLDEDLRRYLEGLPILARGESLWYRAGKFVSRNKMPVAAAAVVLAVLLGGMTATRREARMAERERALAEFHARQAEQERIRALRGEADAQRQKAEADRRLAELMKLAQDSMRAYVAAVQKAEADRRLAELMKLAHGSMRDYVTEETGSGQPANLLGEIVRDSTLALSRARAFDPGMAPAFDAAVAELRSRELASPLHWEVPKGWVAVAKNPWEYGVGVDRQRRYAGSPTLFLRSLTPVSSGGVNVFQTFSAVRYRGKRVRLSAALRTEKVKPEAVLGLYIAVPYSLQPYVAGIRGSGAWTPREVVADVPPDAENITISFRLKGTGSAWVTNFDFQEVSISVPLTVSGPQNLDFTLYDK